MFGANRAPPGLSYPDCRVHNSPPAPGEPRSLNSLSQSALYAQHNLKLHHSSGGAEVQ